MTAQPTSLTDRMIGYAAVVQDFTFLCGKTLAALARPPWYIRETILQMDRIGVGSIFIVVLTGLFTGMVLALQGAVQLEPYGATMYVSRLISTSVVRELGPVLAALMIAGRVGTGIASEIASMKVTEQLDALRAEGAGQAGRGVAPGGREHVGRDADGSAVRIERQPPGWQLARLQRGVGLRRRRRSRRSCAFRCAASGASRTGGIR